MKSIIRICIIRWYYSVEPTIGLDLFSKFATYIVKFLSVAILFFL